jgi:hypothetical protein
MSTAQSCVAGYVKVPIQMGCDTCGSYCVGADSGGWAFQQHEVQVTIDPRVKQASLGTLAVIGLALGAAVIAASRVK